MGRKMSRARRLARMPKRTDEQMTAAKVASSHFSVLMKDMLDDEGLPDSFCQHYGNDGNIYNVAINTLETDGIHNHNYKVDVKAKKVVDYELCILG
ncbi:MAG: hypothetical protein HZB68_05240 [Candidatus Aenigmarchaeota archaeon]|nr:hypothetical protein [Candidatus Aenigmarchaeota archaeon]